MNVRVHACAEHTQDAVKPGEAGQLNFVALAESLDKVQDDQMAERDGLSNATVHQATTVNRVANIGVKRAKNTVQGGGTFQVKDFIKHLKHKFPGAAAEDDADGSLDWAQNSKVPHSETRGSCVHAGDFQALSANARLACFRLPRSTRLPWSTLQQRPRLCVWQIPLARALSPNSARPWFGSEKMWARKCGR